MRNCLRVFHFETKFCLRFYRNFGLQVVVKSPQLFCFGSFPRLQTFFTVAFIAKSGTNFVQWAAQLFGIQKPTSPRHGKAMCWEVGVIKLTAKPASVLANQNPFEGINEVILLTHYRIRGISIGFRRSSQRVSSQLRGAFAFQVCTWPKKAKIRQQAKIGVQRKAQRPTTQRDSKGHGMTGRTTGDARASPC